jgi:hypothetical protein
MENFYLSLDFYWIFIVYLNCCYQTKVSDLFITLVIMIVKACYDSEIYH